MGSVLVIAETAGGKLRKATLSAVTFARQLAAKTGGDYSIAVLGSGVGAVAADAANYGAKAVYVVDSPALASYLAGPWAKLVADVAAHAGATAVAAASTTFTRDLLPRVAARLGAGMVSEVLEVVDGTKFKRPMWAGNVVATVEVKTPKAVFTVRGTEFEPAAPGGTSPVQPLALALADDGKAKFANFAPTVSERPDLGEAKVIVSGGRGLKDAEGWKLLNPLADLFGAAIGATRAVVDAGFVANDLQVGQTGKVVAPNLYFAIGLSGAIQHIAGMKNSKVIVAINKDAEAPIFSVADYGLVGDAFKLVPELVDEIKKARAG
jgi:electron transfer flavoprotein alpha subunit